MKILFVSQYFWPETFKGNDIAFFLASKGHDVTVLTAKPNYPMGKLYTGYSFLGKNEEIIQGVSVIRTPIIPRGKGNGLSLILNYFSFVFFSYFAVHFRLKKHYDVVFVQQLSPVTVALPGIWAKRKFNCPMYLWVLDLWPESLLAASSITNVLLLNLLNKTVNFIYNSSDKILISSKFFESAILPRIKDKQKEIIYFPNWAEEVFTKQFDTNNTDLPDLPDGFNIMFAGNVGEAQDFNSLVDAAKLSKDINVNWIIVGDGRKMSWLQKEIKKNSLEKVKILGRYPIEQMPYFFSKANAMIVSLKDEPVFSLTVPAKIQAYMASSKIILGMLNGEGRELINNSGGGIAVPAGNYSALVESIKKLIKSNPETLREKESKSKQYYLENFDRKKLLDKLENILLNDQ